MKLGMINLKPIREGLPYLNNSKSNLSAVSKGRPHTP